MAPRAAHRAVLRSYHSEQTRSHQNSEVNLNWAAPVLGREITWEPAVSQCLRNRPTGELKSYIDWILSEEGQQIVKQVGYFSLR